MIYIVQKIFLFFLLGKNIFYYANILHSLVMYFLRSKFYDGLDISHILRNVINIVWEKDIMSCFTKLSSINDMGKINERIEKKKE